MGTAVLQWVGGQRQAEVKGTRAWEAGPVFLSRVAGSLRSEDLFYCGFSSLSHEIIVSDLMSLLILLIFHYCCCLF